MCVRAFVCVFVCVIIERESERERNLDSRVLSDNAIVHRGHLTHQCVFARGGIYRRPKHPVFFRLVAELPSNRPVMRSCRLMR